jgi:uncharacterized damage-inducible protein DinB
MLKDIQSFISYFEGIRRRTLNYIKTIPADRLQWSPREGEFTVRDLVLHIAVTEKMFVGVFVTGKWKYEDNHAAHDEDTLDQLVAHLEQNHSETMDTLRAVSDDELYQPRPTLEGTTLKAWRLLMMMVEHEVHHRSQLAVYLMLMGVEPPQIYGLGVEEVIARATG